MDDVNSDDCKSEVECMPDRRLAIDGGERDLLLDVVLNTGVSVNDVLDSLDGDCKKTSLSVR